MNAFYVYFFNTRIVKIVTVGLTFLLISVPTYSEINALRTPASMSKCVDIFSDKKLKTTFERLRDVSNGGLAAKISKEMLVELMSHPIWQRFASDPNEGASLEFSFVFSDNKSLSPGEVIHGLMGESVQAHFVASVLKQIFPKATFYSDNGSALPGKLKIKIFLFDASEGTNSKWVDEVMAKRETTNWIDMPIAKSANGRSVYESKVQVREILGVNPNQFVVSDYNFNLGFSRDLPLPTFVESIHGRDPKDIIVFGTSRIVANGSEEAQRGLTYFTKKMMGIRIHLLSQLKFGDLSGPGPHFVINDVKGMMPAINKAADVVLIAGPMNLFEGLSAGTPTVFQSYTGGAPLYNLQTYARMKRIALATHGAFEVSNPSEVLYAVSQIASQPTNTILNPSLVQINGVSPFTTFLNELEKILDRSIPQ